MGGMSAVRARLLAAAGATMAATCTSLASSDAGAPLDRTGPTTLDTEVIDQCVNTPTLT